MCLKSNIYIYITHETNETHTIKSQLKILNVAIAREMDFISLDSVFQEEGENFWNMIAADVSGDGDGDITVSVPNRSAFRSYVRDNEQRMVSSSSVNVKRRMVNLLRKNWEGKKIVAVPEKERCRQHMMKERTRREKQKQSYLALHSLLPFGTKVHYFVDLLCINFKRSFIFLNDLEIFTNYI